ncbi:MAG: N-acetyltransferase family protein [Prevotella sp.]|nr:N-acetyltransferase family protein [Prevotella sp.]
MIREISQSDIPDITKIYNHYVLNGVESFETEALTDEQMLSRAMWIALDYPFYVMPKEGTIAGFCYVHQWKERAAYCNTYETTVYVSPEFQRQGIATQLMKKLIAECRSRGGKALVACITGSNVASIAFHEKLGFKKVSHFEKVGYKFGQWLDVVDYELLL